MLNSIYKIIPKLFISEYLLLSSNNEDVRKKKLKIKKTHNISYK